MDADNFFRVNNFYHFLDCCSVSVTRGVNIHNIVEHLAKNFVLWICFYLLWVFVVAIP